jgi:hypothetical protein
MASMNGKRIAAVATLATSVVLMSGAAFASPARATAGSTGTTTGLAPDPVGKAVETARDTAADVLNQIKRATAGSTGTTTGLAPDPVGKAAETARDTAADVLNQIKRAV